jgi:hypothetical protein
MIHTGKARPQDLDLKLKKSSPPDLSQLQIWGSPFSKSTKLCEVLRLDQAKGAKFRLLGMFIGSGIRPS